MAKLKRKTVKKYKGKVYDLTVNNTHSYNIEDIGVHNSAAGCLLSWCLDITKIDPLRFNLYFERFLNPTRKGPPDLDIDFESGTDEKTLQFLYDKYGKERVVPVITFGTFNEKGCIKDVARALGQDAGFESDVFAVTKEMPKKWDMSLKEWFESWPKNKDCSQRVKRWLEDPNNKEILVQTLKLQKQVRNLGKHAAGIVITPTPVWDYMPVNIVKGHVVSGFQESSFNKDLSTLGILKLDRLNLSTLNIIKGAIKLIEDNREISIKDKVDYVDLEDLNLYKELLEGNNHGVFQFESPGMNALIKGMDVTKFDELVAANALYRPGPMGIGAHEEYIRNKFNPEAREYVHESLIPLLEETNGVLIFQEQLMFIASEIGGLSLGEGDNLRKVMDKASKIIAKKATGEKLKEEEEGDKNYKSYLELWEKFKKGAKENGLKEKEVDDLESWLIKYLGYSFNKSHSISYSYLAAQTLYLKHYYPTEFYTSLLNNAKSSTDKEKEKQWLMATVLSAMLKGIKIVPPTRKSKWEWTMVGENEIAMGFSAINGMGDIAYEELIKHNVSDVSKEDFFSIKFSKFNKKAFESCLKAGVFDDWSESREELKELRALKIKNTQQLNLFGGNDFDFAASKIAEDFSPTSREDKYKDFMEVCNLDLRLLNKNARFRRALNAQYDNSVNSVNNFEDKNSNSFYFFYLSDIEERYNKRGGRYFLLTVGDGISSRRMIMGDSMYLKNQNKIEKGKFYITKFKKENGWLRFNEDAPFKLA